MIVIYICMIVSVSMETERNEVRSGLGGGGGQKNDLSTVLYLQDILNDFIGRIAKQFRSMIQSLEME